MSKVSSLNRQKYNPWYFTTSCMEKEVKGCVIDLVSILNVWYCICMSSEEPDDCAYETKQKQIVKTKWTQNNLHICDKCDCTIFLCLLLVVFMLRTRFNEYYKYVIIKERITLAKVEKITGFANKSSLF